MEFGELRIIEQSFEIWDLPSSGQLAPRNSRNPKLHPYIQSLQTSKHVIKARASIEGFEGKPPLKGTQVVKLPTFKDPKPIKLPAHENP